MMNNRLSDRSWIIRTFVDALKAEPPAPLDKWVDSGALMLPNNTAEPGRYSLERTPYQRKILEYLSPESPVQKVTLCTGAQIGKTTIEIAAMCYFIEEVPAPIGFFFSDDNNLRSFVKFKFDPFLNANPEIKALLKSEGRNSASTLTSKQFPGGFLKFASGKSDASLRSDSLRVLIFDELDSVKATKEGDPISRLEKRANTYGDRKKICLSSTPSNDGLIYGLLQSSTFNKYFMPCPHCGGDITFELDMLHWDSDENGNVLSAWMECPLCGGRIRNSDKVYMMKPENGAGWKPTNTKADPLHQGFYLPSFYAPVGWLSFTDIAKEYVEAGFTEKGIQYDKMTTFYNTVLALPYQSGADTLKWRQLYESSLTSEYKRGDVPEWVLFITSGSDVQGNRIETTVMGWGFRGRNLVIDHYVFPVPGDEDIEIINGEAWRKYTETILDGTWIREDGLEMRSIANGLDRSYKPDAIMGYYLSLTPDEQKYLYPVRGNDRMQGFIPTQRDYKKEGLKGARYWDAPVSQLKHHVFDHLSFEDNPEHTKAFIPHFPADFDQEFYQQLFSEIFVKVGSKYAWEKIRDRNEILDCRVYNYAMYYLSGLGTLSDSDWEEFRLAQKESLNNAKEIKRYSGHARRQLSKGIQL